MSSLVSGHCSEVQSPMNPSFRGDMLGIIQGEFAIRGKLGNQQPVTVMLSYWKELIFLVLLARIVYRRYLHPLHHVPGPVLGSVSRMWLLTLAHSGRQHLLFMDAHKKYGTVVRVSPNTVIICDPDNFQQYHYFDKSEWWLALRAESGHVSHGTELLQKVHNEKKKRVASAFRLGSVLKLEHKMDIIISDFINQLSRKFVDTQSICDFAPWTHYVAFDIVLEMAFSSPPGFVRHGVDVGGLIASLHGLLNAAQFAGIFPIIMKFVHLPVLNTLIAPQPTDKTGPGLINGLAKKQVQDRLDGEGTHSQCDILQSIIDHRDREGLTIHPKVLENEAVGPVLAGSDTVATVLRAAILYVSTSPRIWERLVKELGEAVGAGRLSRPAKYEEARRLPYLDAVIQEALRIHPVPGAPMYRVVPKEGTTMNGFFLPGGTQIGLLHWQASRNKEVYGLDVETFRPERWLEADETARRKMKQSDVWFGQGAMRCTGMNVGLMEVYKIVTELFLKFEITVINPACAWNEVNYLNFVQKDFLCRLAYRKI